MLILNRWYKRILVLLLVLGGVSAWAQSREKDYVRQDSARFRVWYCPEDAKVVRDLWSELRLRIPVVEQQLRLELADTVQFIVTPSEAEWYRITAGAPLWANGIANPQRGYAVLKSPRFGLPYGPLPTTAVHEYVHLLLEAGVRNVEIPRWLNEGLAQVLAGQLDYMDDASISRARMAGRLHRFYHIDGLMGMNAMEARQAYAESAVAVQLLQSRYGMTGISNLVHDLRGGVPFDEAFRRIFGKSAGAFESEYLQYVEHHFRGSLFADTELVISAAFIVLVLAAGFGVWLRRKRTLRRWKDEDGVRRESSGNPATPPYTINYEIVRNRLHGSEPSGTPDENPPFDRPKPGN